MGSTGDKISGLANKAAGNIKQAAGKVTGSKKLQAEGTLLAAQKLQPVDTAQTLRVRDGHSRVLDGPFAETRELLAGFNLIVARDRDEAMRIARDFPWARFGSIEVRPLEDMDAERERCGAPAAAMAAAVL